jgi:hypothetical protein
MAVINAYTDALIDAGRAKPLKSHGYRTVTSIGSFEIAAADDNGSVYRLDRLPADAIITKVELTADEITGGTDFELGFYDVSTSIAAGAEVDKDVLLGTTSFASGFARGSAKNGLADVAIGNLGKKIYELLGKTISNMKPEYDLALTTNTVGTGAGTVEYLIEYAIPV